MMGPSPTRYVDGPHLSGPRARVLELLQETDAAVSVDQVAAELGLHPNTARKHLDGLVTMGAAAGESTPGGGRGRPARLYVAAGHAEPDSRVRDYAALATVLAGYLSRTSVDPRQEALAAGEAWGRAVTAGEERGSPAHAREVTLRLLSDLGFAPHRAEKAGVVRLVRCPLLDAAREHPEVVCGVHLGMVRGALEQLGAEPDDATLIPFAEPGACILQMTPGPSNKR